MTNLKTIVLAAAIMTATAMNMAYAAPLDYPPEGGAIHKIAYDLR